MNQKSIRILHLEDIYRHMLAKNKRRCSVEYIKKDLYCVYITDDANNIITACFLFPDDADFKPPFV